MFHAFKPIGLSIIWWSVLQRYACIEVQTVLSAIESLQCMLVSRMHLVLIGIDPPNMSGYEGRLFVVPIVALTGHAN